MKVSIITCSLNSSGTITDTISSVNRQVYPDIEHIIIDGLSTDDTLEKIKQTSSSRQVVKSGKDGGLYSALNKGIKISTGNIIGLLHSDDFYTDDNFISRVVSVFSDESVEALYSDVRFVSPHNLTSTVRYYSSARFSPWIFRFGHQPAHPTFFTRKGNFEKYGFYNTSYKIGADFELLLRFLYKHRLKSVYLPGASITMRTGGLSTKSFNSNITLIEEDLRACRENGVYSNRLFMLMKIFLKAPGYFRKG